VGRDVVGLGHPGGRYERTRHNVGFEVVDELSRRHSIRLDREICGAVVGRGDALTLVKPLTYMNRSGYAVRCLLDRNGDPGSDALIVYDDVALELGRLRLRRGGSPGGHRGMESIVENLRTTEVPRLRLGVGAAGGEDLADFVLSGFSEDEESEVEAMVSRAADAAECWRIDGVEAAMNRYNAAAGSTGAGESEGH
jgi:PTH1 family peptidyl-tRNA hydrolase